MKTTKKQLEIFEKSFRYWQKELGMLNHECHVYLWPIEADRAAEISPDNEFKCSAVRLNSVRNKNWDNSNKTIKDEAKHEAIHLFLSQLTDLARARFTTQNEITRMDEGMVRVLEKLL